MTDTQRLQWQGVVEVVVGGEMNTLRYVFPLGVLQWVHPLRYNLLTTGAVGGEEVRVGLETRLPVLPQTQKTLIDLRDPYILKLSVDDLVLFERPVSG